MPAAEQLYAEDFRVGQEFSGQTRRLDESAFAGFAALTGDRHPIHYDTEYARNSRFGGRVAHGLLIASICALGATPLSPRLARSLIAFLEQSSRFMKPVFVGDTVTTHFVVDHAMLNQHKRTGIVAFKIPVATQRGEIAAEAHHVYLLRMRDEGSPI